MRKNTAALLSCLMAAALLFAVFLAIPRAETVYAETAYAKVIAIDADFANKVLPYYIPELTGAAENFGAHWTLDSNAKTVKRKNDTGKSDVTGQYAALYFKDCYYRFFEIEFSILPDINVSGLAGLLFGSTKMDTRHMASGNALYFQPDPNAELFGSTLTVKTTSPNLNVKSDPYKVRAIVCGDYVKVYIDDVLKIEKTFAPELLQYGRIGFFTANTPAKFCGDISIYNLDEHGNRIAQEGGALVESVSITETYVDMLLGGDPVKLDVSVLPSNAANKKINWVSENPDIAVMDKDGCVNALKQGTAVIYAISADGGFRDSVTISVEHTVTEVEAVTLDKSEFKGKVGEKFYLIAGIYPVDAENEGFIWRSSDTSVAMVNNGTVTLIGAGECTITVRSYDGDFSAECKVTCSQADKEGCKSSIVSLQSITAAAVILALAAVCLLRGKRVKAEAEGNNENE